MNRCRGLLCTPTTIYRSLIYSDIPGIYGIPGMVLTLCADEPPTYENIIVAFACEPTDNIAYAEGLGVEIIVL